MWLTEGGRSPTGVSHIHRFFSIPANCFSCVFSCNTLPNPSHLRVSFEPRPCFIGAEMQAIKLSMLCSKVDSVALMGDSIIFTASTNTHLKQLFSIISLRSSSHTHSDSVPAQTKPLTAFALLQ